MFLDQPIRQVIADQQDPKSRLMFTFSSGSSAHTDAGRIYLTEDGGKTFAQSRHHLAFPPPMARLCPSRTLSSVSWRPRERSCTLPHIRSGRTNAWPSRGRDGIAAL